MDAAKQSAIEDAREKIELYQKMLQAIDLLPDNLPGRVWIWTGDLNLDIPYDIATLRRVRAMLGSEWKIARKSYVNTSDGSLDMKYLHTSGVELCVFVRTNIPGATCQRVKVGETTYPVYKIVCSNPQDAEIPADIDPAREAQAMERESEAERDGGK